MTDNKPTAYLNQVSGEGKGAQFTRIAALWPTKNGGFSGEIPPGVLITGRVVIMPAEKSEA
jgi:hypothetical protein